MVLEKLAGASPESLFTEGLAAEVLAAVQEELRRLAEAAGHRIRELACTMLVAIVAHDRTAFWQVGDGAICFRKPDSDRFEFAFWPEKGDYANVTFFVTETNARDHMDVDISETVIAELAMFTDGLERLALNFVTGEAHTPFFTGLFTHMRALPEGFSAESSAGIAAFLNSDRVNKRTDDDKTLILASRAL